MSAGGMHDLELLRAAICVAGFDGTVDQTELAVVRGLVERVGVGRASLKAMIELSCKDKNLYRSQLRLAQPDTDAALSLLVKVARSDGELTPDERILVTHFGDKMGLSPEQVDAIIDRGGR